MPTASEEIASRLAEQPARIVGSGSRPWGKPVSADVLETASLRGWEHEPGDFTAVVGAGESVSSVQERLASKGQMLAIDPPGDGTIGGLFATGDSGPLRHRYGAPRDLIIGVELALADGTVARGGGRVIKNVAGYDLPKLVTGSFGTLGVITEVAVRLHPRPERHATAVVRSGDPLELQRVAIDLASRPLEAEALDVRWDGSSGAILARFAGETAVERATAVSSDVIEEDEDVWREQRERQRGEFVVRVHHLPTQLADVLRAAPAAVGRAGVGTTWVACALNRAITRLSAHAVVLDAPAEARGDDPFSLDDRPERALMQRVKDRFDPDNHCNPGLMLT